MRSCGWIAAAAFLADRITKILSANLPVFGRVILPGVIRLRPVRNTGMAFSLLSGHPRLLAGLGLALTAGGILWLRKQDLRGGTLAGMMLMLGGAAGNLTDRLLAGSVPDMIELLFIRFPVFNVADICLVAGSGWVILDQIRRDRHG